MEFELFCPFLTSAAALEGERVKRMFIHLSVVGLVSSPLLYGDLFTHHYTSVYFFFQVFWVVSM